MAGNRSVAVDAVVDILRALRAEMSWVRAASQGCSQLLDCGCGCGEKGRWKARDNSGLIRVSRRTSDADRGRRRRRPVKGSFDRKQRVKESRTGSYRMSAVNAQTSSGSGRAWSAVDVGSVRRWWARNGGCARGGVVGLGRRMDVWR